jgi:hypothetical protein
MKACSSPVVRLMTCTPELVRTNKLAFSGEKANGRISLGVKQRGNPASVVGDDTVSGANVGVGV